MKKAVTSFEMKELDRRAQKDYGIPSIILMENAGRSSAEEILKDFKRAKAGIFCGRGNNGGDGFVCARYLENKGIKTGVFLLGRYADIKNKDPLINFNILKKMDINIIELNSKKDFENIKRNFRYDFIVDAIFGIGFTGELPEDISNLVNFLNNTNKPIYALDVPSGLDATTGEVKGTCIKAFKTITFGFPKKGFSLKDGPHFVGEVVVKDIGLPQLLIDSI